MYYRLKETTTTYTTTYLIIVVYDTRANDPKNVLLRIHFRYTYKYYCSRVRTLVTGFTRRVQYNNIKLATYLIPTKLFFNEKMVMPDNDRM